MVVIVLIFGSTGTVMAESQDGSKYTGHWTVSIGDKLGSLQITEENIESQKLLAISEETAITNYPNVIKAHLGIAVNNNGENFLVWKIVSVESDTESDTKIHTIYVLDAGTGDLLTSMTKKGGSCGDKDKTKTTSTVGRV